MKNFDLEYKLNEFRKEQEELFDENGKRYTGVWMSDGQCELMLQLIDEMVEDIELKEKLSNAFDKIDPKEALRVFAKNNGLDKNTFISWPATAEFAYWYAQQVVDKIFIDRILNDGD